MMGPVSLFGVKEATVVGALLFLFFAQASECHIKENSVEPCRVPTDRDPHGCPVFQMQTREECLQEHVGANLKLLSTSVQCFLISDTHIILFKLHNHSVRFFFFFNFTL